MYCWICTTEHIPAVNSDYGVLAIICFLISPPSPFHSIWLLQCRLVHFLSGSCVSRFLSYILFCVWLLLSILSIVTSIHCVGPLANTIKTIRISFTMNIIVCVFWWAYIYMSFCLVLPKRNFWATISCLSQYFKTIVPGVHENCSCAIFSPTLGIFRG